jgi:hypothetical protein
MAIKRIPTVVGMLLCDQVIVAEKTRDLTPVNSFAVRRVMSFPAKPFPFTVFGLLGGGAGEILLEVAIYRLDTLDEIWRKGRTVRFHDTTVEMVYKGVIRDCSFPLAGYYQAVLLADNEIIAAKKFAILLKEPTK